MKARADHPAPNSRLAVFLDRDGVINKVIEREGLPYPPATPDQFEILPGVTEACHRLKAHGFLLIVATNQPDVGRGTMQRDVVEAMHRRMLAQLPIDAIEVCYHPGKEMSDCDCRKPRPGMLLRAAQQFGIDLRGSWMVGDRWRDVDCGHAAGCSTIFIDRGYSENLRLPPDYRVLDLTQAAELIIKNPKQPTA